MQRTADKMSRLVITNNAAYDVDLSKLRILEASVGLGFSMSRQYAVNLKVQHVHENRLADVSSPVDSVNIVATPVRAIYEAVCRAVLHEVDETLRINGKRVVPAHDIPGDVRVKMSFHGDPRHDDKEQFWLPRYYNKTNVWKLL